jgi:outer membrane protein assembly factor BamB
VTLPEPPSAGGAIDGDRIYVPLRSEQIVALERETGATVWTRDVESLWPPVVLDGVIFVAASDELHALDAATGTARWRVPIPASVIAPMTALNGLVVVTVEPGIAIGMRVVGGEVAWKHELGAPTRFPAAVDRRGTLFFALETNRVRAVAASDGRVQWERDLSGDVGEPSVADDRVLVGTTHNTLYALSADDGDVAWIRKAGGDVVGAGTDGDLSFMASLDNLLVGVNSGNGNQRWKQVLKMRPALPPRAAAGVVWIVGPETLATFSAHTGLPGGTFDFTTPLQGAPLIDPNLRPFKVAGALVTRGGSVIGLRPTAMMFREPAPAPLPALPGRPLLREPRP